MNNYLRQSMALLCLLSWSFNISAYTASSFPSNPGEFLKGLKEYMTASKNAEMEAIYEDFEKQYNRGLFSESDFDMILNTSNLALEKKIPANPYFGKYLQNVILIRSNSKAENKFVAWHNITQALIDDMTGRKFKPIKNFFEFSLSFFEKNALRFSEKGVSWYFSEADYKFVYHKKEAFVYFEKVNLRGELRGNVIALKNAKGSYFPSSKEWKGVGGTGVWERGVNLGQTFQMNGAYTLELDKTVYKVDSVQLSYPDLLSNGPILGTYQDKIFVGSNAAKEVSYPRFESLERNLVIDNIGTGMKFVGGIRLQGAKVYGYGTKAEKAKFTFHDADGAVLLKVRAELLSLKKAEKMTGQSVHCVLYFGSDSLYHPSTNFNLNLVDQSIELTRGDRGNDRNPYFSSLHQVNVDVDHIKWMVAENRVEIGHRAVSFAKVEKKVVFESLKYFKESDYNRLQNISSTNPIATIKVFSEEKKTRFLDANELAKRFNPRFEISSINSLIYDLVAKGFINYDKDQKVVEVKDKVFHYADASQGMVSFDQLRIESVADSTNAILDLKNNTISTNGVKKVEFSKRHNVALKPFGESIQLRQNRDIGFDGKLFAGFSTFNGKDFSFVYDQNHIEMDSIRYFDVFVPSGEKDKMGRPVALSIASRIEHANGVLLIDAPENKGGEKDISFFPSFKSKRTSYVYYDSPETLDTCYTRDSFYFAIAPFSLVDLDNLQKEQLEFKGKMVSAGIFDEFEETLLLDEEDQSLGFLTQTSDEGFANYQGKGKFIGEISLSNRGFLAKGNIQYKGASIQSEDIIFKPKQMTSSADQFNLEENRSGAVQVPQTVGYDVSIDWRPYVDSMYIYSKDRPFELFKEDNYTLEGLQILTPGGLKGRGQFNWDKGKMNSDLISFGAFSARADTAVLQIVTFGSDDFAFDTRNVQTDFDFDKKIGWVKANDESHVTTMPYNQYITTLDEFTWDMEKESITFQNEEGLSGDFTSIHPDKDSLFFQGTFASYDLKTNDLKIKEVPFIKASDALIYPGDGMIEINSGGEMSILENAKIIADTVSRYHVVNRATVEIIGRKEYRASGFYEYNVGEHQQEIEFKNIIGTRVGKGKKSNKKSLTRASGEVGAEAHLHIDHHTEFRGDISWSAENVNLKFDGFAKINSSVLPKASWFSISCEADKNDLRIDYDLPKNEAGQALHTGIFLSKENARLYAPIMGPLYFAKDRSIFSAKGEERGLLKYDIKADEFVFGDSMRVLGFSRYGNVLRLNNKTGDLVATGEINLGAGLKYMNLTSAGIIKTKVNQNADGQHGPASTDLALQTMTGVNWQIPDKLMKILITDLQASTFDARPIDYAKDSDFYETTMPLFIPDSKALVQEIAEMKNYGMDLPTKYNDFSMLFSLLDLKWEEEAQSFYTTKEFLGLASVKGISVNRMVKGFVQFRMPGNEDDQCHIYVVSPSEDWYYFSYKQGILSLTSSNPKFMEALEGMKEKELVSKQKDGEFYEIQAVSNNVAQVFVNRAKAAQAKK